MSCARPMNWLQSSILSFHVKVPEYYVGLSSRQYNHVVVLVTLPLTCAILLLNAPLAAVRAG